MKKILLKTENEMNTRILAGITAENVPSGQIIALNGDLAAGKSVFSSSALANLGYTGKVTSPTYTIMNEYDTPSGKAYHMDAYRLTGSDELEYTGYYDAVTSCRIMLIEWAEIIEDALDKNTLYIDIKKDDEDYDVRYFEMYSQNEELVNKLSEELDAYIIH